MSQNRSRDCLAPTPGLLPRLRAIPNLCYKPTFYDARLQLHSSWDEPRGELLRRRHLIRTEWVSYVENIKAFRTLSMGCKWKVQHNETTAVNDGSYVLTLQPFSRGVFSYIWCPCIWHIFSVHSYISACYLSKLLNAPFSLFLSKSRKWYWHDM